MMQEQDHAHEHAHEHGHGHMHDHDCNCGHDHGSQTIAGIQGSPRTMFFLGLFVGLASFAIVALAFVMWATFGGKGLALAAGSQQNGTQQVAQNNPTPTAQQQQAQPTNVNVSVGHFPVKGSNDAKVTIVEFADFRCPFCERFYKDANTQIDRDYVNTGKVKFAFRNFAFLGDESTWASEAAECANEQGQFWKYHDWLYNNQAPESDLAYYSKDNLIKYAVNLGLNKDKFATCLNSDKYKNSVAQDLSDGQTAGVTGTPTIFVNGKMIVGAVPYAQVKSAIDAALAATN